MKKFSILIVTLALLGSVGCGRNATSVKKQDDGIITVNMERTQKRFKRGYMPNYMVLTNEPQERLKEPEYKGTPKYASLKMGNAPDSIITIALDEYGAEANIYIDKNNDNDLTNDGDIAWTRTGKPRKGKTDFSRMLSKVEVTSKYVEDGKSFSLPYYLNMYRFFGIKDDDRRAKNLYFYPSTTLVGQFQLGDQSTMMALAENRADGDFSDMMQKPPSRGVAGLMVDFNGDGKIASDARLPEQIGSGRVCCVTEPFVLYDKSWKVTDISPSGRLTIMPSMAAATPPVWPVLPKTAIGDPAPLFTQTDIYGKTLSLKDLRGKVVLLDFWATWCGPCVAELPNVVKTWEQFKDQDFVIVSISFDQSGSLLSCNIPKSDPERNAKRTKNNEWLKTADKAEVEKRALAELKTYAKNNGMSWKHLYEGKGWKTELGAQYDVKGIPAMFLVGRDGKIVGKNLRGAKLAPAVKKALEK
jgi:thiol-disulfide isomerase/thioredoxin